MCFNLSLNKASSDTVGLVSLVPGRRRHLLRDQAHWVSEVPLRERPSSRQGPGKVNEMVPLHGCLGLSFRYSGSSGFSPNHGSVKQVARVLSSCKMHFPLLSQWGQS